MVLKELRAECDKLADELDTISKERARAERKYNAMMGTKQTSLNRVDELKRSIEEAKAAVASFDLLSQAAEAEIRAVREREAFLEGELLTAQSQRDESQQAYSQLKETLKEISSSQLGPKRESEGEGERTADSNVAENEHKQEEEEEEFSEDAEIDESAVLDDENADKTTPSEANAELRDQSDKHKGENVTSDCEGSDMDTTAASTPERSAMTSSSSNSNSNSNNNSDDVLLTTGNSATDNIKRLSESAPHPSSSSQTSLSAIQKETQAASDDERQTSRETVETYGTRSHSGHGTTSVDSQRKASGNSSRSASASSLAPPPKPAKPRSKPPDKLSIPLGSSSRFGYGGRTESESEFVEISL